MKQSVLLLCAVAGCVSLPVLMPDGDARRVGEKVAFTEVAGVRVWVNGDAWVADPLDLTDVLTPVHVHLENTSSSPLRLAYRELSLVGESGTRYAALAPLPADPQLPLGQAPSGAVVRYASAQRASPVRVAPRFRYRRFYVASQYGWYYSGYPLWPAPFPYTYYGAGPYVWPRALPTDDMIAEALPEGVLAPNGRVDGFVFFQRVAGREQRLRFDFKLVDAQTGAAFGEAVIPLRVQLR